MHGMWGWPPHKMWGAARAATAHRPTRAPEAKRPLIQITVLLRLPCIQDAMGTGCCQSHGSVITDNGEPGLGGS